MIARIRYCVLSLICCVCCSSCRSPQVRSKSVVDQKIPFDTALMELPRLGCTANERLISHCGFNLSYNDRWLLANWVAYELTAEETQGEEKRRNYSFLPDPEVPNGATSADYSGSGFCRGHLAPAADMKWDACAMRSSFYFTNICPQDKDLNNGCWERLERRCRGWAKQQGGSGIYIVCGPVVKSTERTIGRNRVVVPSAFYKVILRKRKNRDEGVGFVMPNRAESASVEYYAVSIDAVEALTGIDFFCNLPDEVESVVEASFRYEDWNLKQTENTVLQDAELW